MKTTLDLFITKRGPLPVLLLTLLGAGLAGIVRGQVVTEVPVPAAGSEPRGVASGPDGNLWFTEVLGNNISRITPGGVVTEFPVPTANSEPWDIAFGADGNLWFTEAHAGQIGRITADGVVTEFTIPTVVTPGGIVAGPDGNLWFTEHVAYPVSYNKLGRISTAGTVTEFSPSGIATGAVGGIAAGPDGNLWLTHTSYTGFTGHTRVLRVNTAGVSMSGFSTGDGGFRGTGSIAAGPDGNLWFTLHTGFPQVQVYSIGRVTTAGVVTEFSIPTSGSAPQSIAAGPDGNLWFAEGNANQIARITTAGVITEFEVPTASAFPQGIVAGPDGNLWFTELVGNQIGQITTAPLTSQPMAVDAHAVSGGISDTNGMLEPGENVQVAPSWKNTLADSQTFTGTASNLAGPPGPMYAIVDSSADYGTMSAGATGDCNGATGDCYLMTVSGTRPSAHWDATFTEDLSSSSVSGVRTLHIGESFPDVPRTNQFYGFIENLFHNGITGGCAGGDYCPDNAVTRAQMAVFLMKGKLGSIEISPPATGTVFTDVHVGDPYADWIEQLAGFQITGGCGNGNYCPTSPVTRAQMAVFLLKAEHGSSYAPPTCAGAFADVACPSQFANWIEQLAAEGITGGCGGGNYCPDAPNTRGQMAVFLVKTFGLQLYGP